MPEIGKNERRSQARFKTELPLSVRRVRDGTESRGAVRDLSTKGVFFYTESPLNEGSELEIVLMLPPEIAAGEKRWVCCQAAVVRVEKQTGNTSLGVAASIRSMQILPEISL